MGNLDTERWIRVQPHSRQSTVGDPPAHHIGIDLAVKNTRATTGIATDQYPGKAHYGVFFNSRLDIENASEYNAIH